MVRPPTLKIGPGSFALAASRRRIAISFVAGTLDSAAAFSIAVASPGASTTSSRICLAASL
jgi:hypothetical protein